MNSVEDPNKGITTTLKPYRLIGKKISAGEWIAQWDNEYSRWFYYNRGTGTSTWTKPTELNGILFKSAAEKKEEEERRVMERKKRLWKEKSRRRRLNKKKKEGARRIAIERSKKIKRREEMLRRSRKEKEPKDGSDGWGIDILGFLWPEEDTGEEKKSLQRRLEVEERADIASDRIFVSDDETYEFYGFNTTYLDKGSRGILGSLADTFAGLYDTYVADYVTNQYRDFVEGYTDATLKLFAWFTFSSFLVIHGALVNELDDSTTTVLRSEGRRQGDSGVTRLLKDLGFSLPTLKGCYKQRISCLEDDLSAELTLLLERVLDLTNFVTKWSKMSQTVSNVMEQDDYIL